MVSDEQRREAYIDAAIRRERQLKASKENGAPPSSPYRPNMSEAQREIMRMGEQIERTMVSMLDGWSELDLLKEISNG